MIFPLVQILLFQADLMMVSQSNSNSRTHNTQARDQQMRDWSHENFMVATYAKHPELAYKTLKEILREMSYEELPIIRRQITLALDKARSKKTKAELQKSLPAIANAITLMPISTEMAKH
ncbi:hypothetical protein TU85_18075 [Pseudomonas helleri]|nr:hypothetical protein TU85_18075 [Pseudomonas helleri]